MLLFIRWEFFSLDQSSWDIGALFPFSFQRDFEMIEDGWNVFSIELEFSRLKTISDDWRLTDVNKNFAVGVHWRDFFIELLC